MPSERTKKILSNLGLGIAGNNGRDNLIKAPIEHRSEPSTLMTPKVIKKIGKYTRGESSKEGARRALFQDGTSVQGKTVRKPLSSIENHKNSTNFKLTFENVSHQNSLTPKSLSRTEENVQRLLTSIERDKGTKPLKRKNQLKPRQIFCSINALPSLNSQLEPTLEKPGETINIPSFSLQKESTFTEPASISETAVIIDVPVFTVQGESTFTAPASISELSEAIDIPVVTVDVPVFTVQGESTFTAPASISELSEAIDIPVVTVQRESLFTEPVLWKNNVGLDELSLENTEGTECSFPATSVNSEPIPFITNFGGIEYKAISDFDGDQEEQQSISESCRNESTENNSSNIGCEDSLEPPSTLLNDSPEKNNPNIEYEDDLQVAETINQTDADSNGKKRKWINKETQCLYCKKSVTHFSLHLTRVHSMEEAVQNIKKLQWMAEPHSQKLKMIKKQGKEASSKEEVEECKARIKEINQQVRAITSNLRYRGAHEVNITRSMFEEIIPKKMPNHGNYKPSRETHSTCPYCYITLRKENLSNHFMKIHPDKKNESEETGIDSTEKATRRRVLATASQTLTPTPSDVSASYKKDILDGMRNNMVTLIVRTDPLLLNVGQRIYRGNRDKKHIKSVRTVVRDLARLYLTLVEHQEDEEDAGESVSSEKRISCFQDCINPKNFKTVMEGVQSLGGFDSETGDVKVVSVSGRYCSTLKICADSIMSEAIQSKDLPESEKNVIKTEMKEFLRCLRFEWRYEIGTNAEKSRQRKFGDRQEEVPLDEDVRLLSDLIEDRYPSEICALQNDPTAEMFQTLCALVIVDMIALNRRRPSEVTNATLENFSNLINDSDRYEGENVLQSSEKRATEELKIFYVVGKNGDSVPILVTKLMESAIEVLMRYRKKFNIPSEPAATCLLFPKPYKNGELYDGSSLVSAFVRKNQSKFKEPKLISCRSLRRHIATESQLHDADSGYTSNLASFLGHTLGVHHRHYRRPVPLVHRVQVGARLLKFRRPRYTSSPSIDNGGCEESVESCDIPEDLQGTNDGEANEIHYSNFEDHPESNTHKNRSSDSDSSISEDSEDEPQAKKRKKHKKVSWTEKEKNLVFDRFGSFIKKGVNPKRSEVKAFLDSCKPSLNRTLAQVVTYINNHVRIRK